MTKNILLLILFVVAFNAKAQTDFKEYYYPIGAKKEVKVYKYVDKNDATRIEYWKVTSIPETNELKTVSYDWDFNVYNTFYEVMTENGAELTAYSDFEQNEKGEWVEIKATVIDRDVYQWNGNKEYVYSVNYVSKYGRFYFKKKRAESGFENINVGGKEYQALKFKDDYLIYAITQGIEQRFYQDTYYAKHIGMIKYKRKIPVQHEFIELELTDILTEQEFEKLMKEANK